MIFFFYIYRCPEDWYDALELGCFYFGDEVNSDGITWFESQIYCKRMDINAHLAEVPDQKTQDYLSTILDSLSGPNDKWWIGATNIYTVIYSGLKMEK